MQWFDLQSNSSLAYSLLFVSVALLWLPLPKRFPLWQITLLLSVAFAIAAQHILPLGLLPLMGLAVLCYYQKASPHGLIQWIVSLLIIVISIGLSMHQFPGFDNMKLFDHIRISAHSLPYTMYLNMDKTIAGVLLIGVLQPVVFSPSAWFGSIKYSIQTLVFLLLLLIPLALIEHFIKLDIKIPNILPLWALTQLLFICMAEEAIFRGFLQRKLTELCNKINIDGYFAILTSSIIFGLIHYKSGSTMILFATIAGLGYGWVYDKSKRIEAAILTHFAFNLCHLLLFTYPALQ